MIKAGQAVGVMIKPGGRTAGRQQPRLTRRNTFAQRTRMKPDTTTAMHQLIAQVRQAIPFGLPQAQACTGECNGCTVKLLDYLDGELADWEARLAAGQRPSLGDLHRLGRTSRRVYLVLAANGLVPAEA